MARLVDILQVEKDRQEEATWAVVHLFKTGSFYSAYEWSAWLIAVITFNDEVRMFGGDTLAKVIDIDNNFLKCA